MKRRKVVGDCESGTVLKIERVTVLDNPMCCPNTVHDSETNSFAGMNIVPDPDKETRWKCLDCGRSFVRKDSVSTFI